jgi:hypothetical protein
MSDYNQQLVVQPYQPGRRRIEIVLSLSLAVLLFVLGYMLGSQYFSEAMVEKKVQQQELEQLRLQTGEMAQRLANAELASNIDRAALEQVRQVVTSLQTELAVDKEELGLYRNLLQSDGVKTGLLVGELLLRSVPDAPNSVSYRLVVQQKEAKLKRIKVNIAMTLNGLQDGKQVSLTLESLDEQFDQSPIETEFKYFHLLEGVASLPPNFVPQELVVAAWKNGISSSRVERRFDWQVDEN